MYATAAISVFIANSTLKTIHVVHAAAQPYLPVASCKSHSSSYNEEEFANEYNKVDTTLFDGDN